MSDACPIPGPDDPLVRGLLATTDCHVEGLVRDGYGALFEASGPFAAVLTALLTAYVALLGYRLLLGRAPLSVGDLAVTAVKIGAVVALSTQWATYDAVVYRSLFQGPQQVADIVMRSVGAHGSGYGPDIFDGLQRAFDDLTAFSPASPPGAAIASPSAPIPGAAPAAVAQVSTLLGKPGFDSLLLLGSAVVLLVSSLGLLLASKIVLGLLLALGPVFIALLLFESTRGVFEGWLRASLGFAFAPLAVTLLLGLALTLLEPSLQAIETMRDQHLYTPGVGFGVFVLVLVFAGVAAGLTVAGGLIAGGFKLPRAVGAVAAPAVGALASIRGEAAVAPRVTRVAAAAVAQERRDAAVFAQIAATQAAGAERRLVGPVAGERGTARAPVDLEVRLGAGSRRSAGPRVARGGVRSGA